MSINSLARKHWWKPIVCHMIVLLIISAVTLKIFVSTSVTVKAATVTGLTTSGLTDITNWYRGAEGHKPLAFSDKLSAVAKARAEHMSANNYFAHVYNGVQQLSATVTSIGLSSPTGYIGENLYRAGSAIGSSDLGDDNLSVIGAWLNSPGHHANMMLDGYKMVGFGWVEHGGINKDLIIVVQVFADRIDGEVTYNAPAPAPVAKVPTQPTPAPAPTRPPTTVLVPEVSAVTSPVVPVAATPVVVPTASITTNSKTEESARPSAQPVTSPTNRQATAPKKLPNSGPESTLKLAIIVTFCGYFYKFRQFTMKQKA